MDLRRDAVIDLVDRAVAHRHLEDLHVGGAEVAIVRIGGLVLQGLVLGGAGNVVGVTHVNPFVVARVAARVVRIGVQVFFPDEIGLAGAVNDVLHPDLVPLQHHAVHNAHVKEADDLVASGRPARPDALIRDQAGVRVTLGERFRAVRGLILPNFSGGAAVGGVVRTRPRRRVVHVEHHLGAHRVRVRLDGHLAALGQISTASGVPSRRTNVAALVAGSCPAPISCMACCSM